MGRKRYPDHGTVGLSDPPVKFKFGLVCAMAKKDQEKENQNQRI